jgi:hypothetical protein
MSFGENMYNKSVELEGIMFDSLKQAIEHYGLFHNRVYGRIHRGWTLEQAFELKPAPYSIKLEGITYKSVKQAAAAYNLNENTIETRLSRGWSPDQAFGLEAPPRQYRSSYNEYLLKQGKRLCKACGLEKPITQFYKPRSETVYPTNCSSCCKIKARHDSRKRIFGLDEEEWQILFESQNRCCAICRKDKPGKSTWHTDHDHTTNKVRGILCRDCNLLLGFAKDNTTTLKQAITYLENSYIDPEEVA